MIFRRLFLWGGAIFLAGALLMGMSGESKAAGRSEGSKTGYNLGRGGPMAGMVPPPGAYLRYDLYSYSGDSDDLLKEPEIIDQNIESESFLNILAMSWVPDLKILGGRLALGAGMAFGRQHFEGDLAIDASFMTVNMPIEGSTTSNGDLGIGVSLGWHAGSSHWQIYNGTTVPIGDYEEDKLSSMGKNRWAFDVGFGYTYLNLNNGFEASALLGIVNSLENPDTDFTPGKDCHLEMALVEHFPNRLSFGVAGYIYRQITEDQGPGSKDDLGEVNGVGPVVGYFWKEGDGGVAVNFKWYHEFAVKNRLEGDVFFTTIGIGF